MWLTGVPCFMLYGGRPICAATPQRHSSPSRVWLMNNTTKTVPIAEWHWCSYDGHGGMVCMCDKPFSASHLPPESVAHRHTTATRWRSGWVGTLTSSTLMCHAVQCQLDWAAG